MKEKTKENLRDLALFTPFAAILIFLGIAPVILPLQFADVLFPPWIYIITFLFSYITATYLMNKIFEGHQRFRRFSYVYGMIVGALITGFIVPNLSDQLVNFARVDLGISAIITVFVSIGATLLAFVNYRRRFRFHPLDESAKRSRKYRVIVYARAIVFILVVFVVVVNVFNLQLPYPISYVNPPLGPSAYIPFGVTYPSPE